MFGTAQYLGGKSYAWADTSERTPENVTSTNSVARPLDGGTTYVENQKGEACRPSALFIQPEKTLEQELTSPVISPHGTPPRELAQELVSNGFQLGSPSIVLSHSISTSVQDAAAESPKPSVDMRRGSLHEEYIEWKAKLEDGGTNEVTEDQRIV